MVQSQCPTQLDSQVQADTVEVSIPLIWTSKGNLPVDSLRYVPLWTIADNAVEFVEEYYLGDELVRRNVHIYSRN